MTARFHHISYAKIWAAGGDIKMVAQVLLSLAGDHPRLVETTSDGFRVPYDWAYLHGLVEELPAAPPADAGAAGDLEPPPAGRFEPGGHSVAEVVAYLAGADFDERVRVVAAEGEGAARRTIMRWRPKPAPPQGG